MRLFSRDTKIEALKRSPLFADLTRKQLELVARLTDDLEVEPGKVLTREGDRGREFFVILEGEAEVMRNGKRVAALGAGDFFGEIALLEDVPRTATVTAKTPLRFFVVTQRAFEQLVDDHPGVERKILCALARRVFTDRAAQ